MDTNFYFDTIDRIILITRKLYGRNRSDIYIKNFLLDNANNTQFFRKLIKDIGNDITFADINDIMERLSKPFEYVQINRALSDYIISINPSFTYKDEYIRDYIDEEIYNKDFLREIKKIIDETYDNGKEMFDLFKEEMRGNLRDDFKEIVIIVRENDLKDQFFGYVRSWLEMDKMSKEDYNLALTRILDSMYDCDCVDWIYELIVELTENNPEEQIRPTISQIFTLNLMEDTLQFISESVEIDYIILIVGLFKIYNDDEISMACRNIENIYDFTTENDRENLNMLLDKLDTENEKIGNPNTILRKYINDWLKDITEYAPIPNWIIKTDVFGDIIPTHEMLLSLLPKINPKKYSRVNIEDIIRLISEKTNEYTLSNKLTQLLSDIYDTLKISTLEKIYIDRSTINNKVKSMIIKKLVNMTRFSEIESIEEFFEEMKNSNKSRLEIAEDLSNGLREIDNESSLSLLTEIIVKNTVIEEQLISKRLIRMFKKYKHEIDSMKIEKDAKLLIDQGKKQLGSDIDKEEEAFNIIKHELKKYTEKERIAFIEEYYKNQTEMLSSMNNIIFRVLGGSFPIIGGHGLDTNSNDPCLRYGGCRAFTCYENENYNDDTGEAILNEEEIFNEGMLDIIDWFTGNCEVCNRKIRARHHAVRMPLLTGGWLNCYCSWEHVKEDIPDDNQNQLHIANVFENIYNTVGIYDRKWE